MKTKIGAPISASAPIHSLEQRHKDRHFVSQYKTVYQSFMEKPKTMLQVFIETGILRANICRYVAKMETRGQIRVIRKGYCPFTRCIAGFYSTDERQFIKPDFRQLNLFGDKEGV